MISILTLHMANGEDIDLDTERLSSRVCDAVLYDGLTFNRWDEQPDLGVGRAHYYEVVN